MKCKEVDCPIRKLLSHCGIVTLSDEAAMLKQGSSGQQEMSEILQRLERIEALMSNHLDSRALITRAAV